MSEIIYDYLESIDLKEYEGIAVIGSYATNEEKRWSDVDLIFIVNEKKKNKVEIYNNKYFTFSYYLNDEFNEFFKNPNLITTAVKSFANIKILYDPNAHFSKLQERAKEFKWTSVLKEQSKYKAVEEYIGYIEEAQKAIQGLKDNHIGKMLNGIYGLSYGMFKVIRLRDQIQLKSDNEFYDVIYDNLDDGDPIKELSACAFGIKRTTLVDQVEAGLEMFMHIGNSLMHDFSDDEREYVMKLVHEIILVA